MEKYKITYLPTGKSRKMKSFFLYAVSDAEVIQNADDEMNRRFPGGKVISIQGSDRKFIDLPSGN